MLALLALRLIGCDMKSLVWLLELDKDIQPGVLPPVPYQDPRQEQSRGGIALGTMYRFSKESSRTVRGSCNG